MPQDARKMGGLGSAKLFYSTKYRVMIPRMKLIDKWMIRFCLRQDGSSLSEPASAVELCKFDKFKVSHPAETVLKIRFPLTNTAHFVICLMLGMRIICFGRLYFIANKTYNWQNTKLRASAGLTCLNFIRFVSNIATPGMILQCYSAKFWHCTLFAAVVVHLSDSAVKPGSDLLRAVQHCIGIIPIRLRWI